MIIEDRGSSKMLKLMYEKRLDNLSEVIEKLHELASKDQTLQGLKGSGLQKYRIDRVHQLVSQILQSEKEQMLIKVLQRLEQVTSAKINSRESSREIEIKNKEIGQLQAILQQKQRQMKDKDRKYEDIIAKLKQEISTKQKERANLIERKDERKCEQCKQWKIQESQWRAEEKQLAKEVEQSTKIIARLKKDGQEAVRSLKEENERISKQLEKQIHAKKKQSEQLMKLKQERSHSSATITKSKIGEMSKQIQFLQDELFQVTRHFEVIKQGALAQTSHKLDKLKKLFVKFSQSIKRDLEEYHQETSETLKKELKAMIAHCSRKPREDAFGIPDKIVTQVNQLDNELDYFIENELIA